MLRSLSCIFALSLAAACAAGGRATAEPGAGRSSSGGLGAPSGATIEGAWRLVETAVRLPDQPWEPRPTPQGGLFVFSARHYSYFYVRGAEPRPRFTDANQPSDTERAEAYDTFIAGAGSYVFDGRIAAMRADYRKNPNEMTGEVWRWQADLAGDTLRLVFADPPFLPGREWRIALVRVE